VLVAVLRFARHFARFKNFISAGDWSIIRLVLFLSQIRDRHFGDSWATNQVKCHRKKSVYLSWRRDWERKRGSLVICYFEG
jgi:hypothetical protein